MQTVAPGRTRSSASRIACALPTVTMAQSKPLRASGAGPQALDDLVVVRIERRGRPEATCLLQALCGRIERRHLRRSAQPGPLNRIDADAARSEHCSPTARLDVDRRDRSPDAGYHGTADERCHVRGNALGHGDDAARGNDYMLCEACQQRVRSHRPVGAAKRRRTGCQRSLAHRVERVLAKDRPTDDAVAAHAAAWREAEKYALAD